MLSKPGRKEVSAIFLQKADYMGVSSRKECSVFVRQDWNPSLLLPVCRRNGTVWTCVKAFNTTFDIEVLRENGKQLVTVKSEGKTLLHKAIKEGEIVSVKLDWLLIYYSFLVVPCFGNWRSLPGKLQFPGQGTLISSRGNSGFLGGNCIYLPVCSIAESHYCLGAALIFCLLFYQEKSRSPPPVDNFFVLFSYISWKVIW